MFLDFLGFDGSLKDQAEEFLRNAKQDPEWVQNSLIQFISCHNDRTKRGEISVSTIPNYYRVTKLFCLNDAGKRSLVVWQEEGRLLTIKLKFNCGVSLQTAST